MSWASQRQLIYLFIAVLLFIAIGIVGFLYFKPQATCFDGKKNQDEEIVDCGGVCGACLGETKEIITLWSNVLPLGGGVYEVASLVRNPNFFAGLPKLQYTFKLYDENNIIIAIKEGETFMNPNEDYLIFETGITVGERIPKRVFIEFGKLNWKRIEKERAQIVISEKSFSNSDFPSLGAMITNKTLLSIGDIEAAAILFDAEDNAIGVSVTKVGALSPESSQGISFTWPHQFEVDPASDKILIRNNLTNEGGI